MSEPNAVARRLADIHNEVTREMEVFVYDVYSWMEAAMCLWEAVDEIENYPGSNEQRREIAGKISTNRASEGTGALRHKLAPLAITAEEAYIIAGAHGYDDFFDWEFCPWFVLNCIEWDGYGPSLKGNWEFLTIELASKCWHDRQNVQHGAVYCGPHGVYPKTLLEE